MMFIKGNWVIVVRSIRVDVAGGVKILDFYGRVFIIDFYK